MIKSLQNFSTEHGGFQSGVARDLKGTKLNNFLHSEFRRGIHSLERNGDRIDGLLKHLDNARQKVIGNSVVLFLQQLC